MGRIICRAKNKRQDTELQQQNSNDLPYVNRANMSSLDSLLVL